MYARAIRTYQTVADESAPPARLLDELLARLARDCRDARAALLAGDLAGKGRAIGHALAIIGELAASLDHDAAPALAGNLAALWDYASTRLLAGSADRDAAAVTDVERLVEDLRAAFATAAGGAP
ncbi:MAG: flagellar protein FliS [Kofleriaceae bacterium]|nr:flagellar protein FliS [Myxococcales bacterium]MCB9562626.1 flagellar protein FliS [Kofleriaceae bacterium]MCB9574560.1 flagellar protein FliS [Kofleriaceae bacterium]